MNNLSSHCGLTGSRIRASDTDLPVSTKEIWWLKLFGTDMDEPLEDKY